MTIYKGVCLNDSDPVKVRELGLDWARSDFGVLPEADYGGMKVVFDCTSAYLQPILTAQNLQTVMERSYYEGKFILGYNEPDLNNISPETYLERAERQAALILETDPNAQFVLWGGAQGHPMYDKSEWFWHMWARVSRTLRQHTLAIATHWYTQASFTLTAHQEAYWFHYKPIYNYLSGCKAAMNTPDFPHLKDRELWLNEIGMVNYPYVVAHPQEAALYVDTAFHTAKEFCARTAWYLMKQREDNYMSFYDPAGEITGAGSVFQAI